MAMLAKGKMSLERCRKDLYTAAANGNMKDVENLVANNKDILSYKDEGGNLPLHVAVKNKRNDVASFLVEKFPAGSFVLNNENKSPIDLAVQLRINDLVTKMLEAPFKAVVRAAIESRNIDLLKTILESHLELTKRTDNKGLTPLLYAASIKAFDIIVYIIKNFPKSVTYRDHRKRTILHFAADRPDKGWKPVVSELLTLKEGKQLIGMKDEKQRTAYKLAFHRENKEMAEILNKYPAELK